MPIWYAALKCTVGKNQKNRKQKNMNDYQNSIVESKESVGIIRFNRPEALNALNPLLMQEMADVLFASEDPKKARTLL